jgi:hypothetical protein
MTPAERSLLLAVFRWARANEWVRLGGDGWCSKTTSISAVGRGLYIFSKKFGTMSIPVVSVAQAVDVLVALKILPHRFSTSYCAGYESAYWARGIAASPANPDEWAGPRRGWADPEVRVLEPAAPRELAVRP